MRIALFVALLVSASAHADNTVKASVEPPFDEGDRAFMTYASQLVRNLFQESRVVEWYSLRLDEDATPVRVALVCGRAAPDFYLVEKDPTHRWQIIFPSGPEPDCDWRPTLPPRWERREDAAIVHVQNYRTERGNRLIHAGYERVYLALRGSVPVLVADQLLDESQTRVLRISAKISRPDRDGNLWSFDAMPWQIGRFD